MTAMAVTDDREWMLAAARGDIRTEAAHEAVRAAHHRPEYDVTWPEMAEALAEGDRRHPRDPRWDDAPFDPMAGIEQDPGAEEAAAAMFDSLDSLDSPFATPQWPTIEPAELYGPAGDAVRLMDPYTEADPIAVYLQLLAGLGAMIGPFTYVRAGRVDHPPRLFVVPVGRSAKARKGTSSAAAEEFLRAVDPDFMTTRVLGGFGSGEALVDEVRDPNPDDEDDKGALDKRLLVKEGEFSQVLKVCARETSTLSQHLRNAWDGQTLQTRARTKKAIATGAHVAVIGHITLEELHKGLSTVEAMNGYANRHLFICTKRSKLLPFDDDPDPAALSKVVDRLIDVVQRAKRVGRVHFTPDGRDHWAALYHLMAQDDPGGMVGSITARAEPYTLRLALLLALLDGDRLIDVRHLKAAYRLWTYCRASAEFIWGGQLGDETADRLYRAIRDAGSDGLDGTAQSRVFSNKVPAADLERARDLLAEHGLIVTETDRSGRGRPRVTSYAKDSY